MVCSRISQLHCNQLVLWSLDTYIQVPRYSDRILLSILFCFCLAIDLFLMTRRIHRALQLLWVRYCFSFEDLLSLGWLCTCWAASWSTVWKILSSQRVFKLTELNRWGDLLGLLRLPGEFRYRSNHLFPCLSYYISNWSMRVGQPALLSFHCTPCHSSSLLLAN